MNPILNQRRLFKKYKIRINFVLNSTITFTNRKSQHNYIIIEDENEEGVLEENVKDINSSKQFLMSINI